jgi:hypothetical protein
MADKIGTIEAVYRRIAPIWPENKRRQHKTRANYANLPQIKTCRPAPARPD